MMMWMLRRRRKMMMSRRRMWRRKTDPKTGKHTLCELAQLYKKSCALPFHTKSLARSPCIALISVPLATPQQRHAITFGLVP